MSLGSATAESPVSDPVGALYASVGAKLAAIGPSGLSQLRGRLRRTIRDVGLADAHAQFGLAKDFAWDLEAVPLIISAAEWSHLEAGIQQRARMINAFLVDVYGRQEVLRQGIIRPEIILTDPFYRRPCLGLEPERTSPATILRFDLTQTNRGWFFTNTYANTPIGMSFAVQNRRFLTQEAGEIYQDFPDHHSVINFPLRLVEHLRSLSPRSSATPSMVVLTAGPRDPFYMEHSFLARKMGLPLVQGDDLLVLDNHVYFKTILGLERIDVIYRRLNDRHIDPVVFSTDREAAGVPGLIQCIRSRTVAVANSIGTGIAENRALDAFASSLTYFYLNEKPIIAPVPTHSCFDHDVRELILEHQHEMKIFPSHEAPVTSFGSAVQRRSPGFGRLDSPSAPLMGPAGFAREVLDNPHLYVARENLVRPAFVPTMMKLRNQPPFFAHYQPAQLSCFVLCQGKEFTVLPGALAVLGEASSGLETLGSTADTVVLKDVEAFRIPEREVPQSFTAHRLVLGSHAAESLFWLGRYTERAEATARMLSILEDVALEEIPRNERKRWLPLWQGVLEATGHGSEKIDARQTPQNTFSGDLIWRMALDASNPSSIYSSILMAAENTVRLRDYMSPEAWLVLNRLLGKLESLSRRQVRETHRRSELSRECVQATLVEVNAFLGTAERTMIHDAGWHFVRLGSHLERGTMTCSTLRHILGSPNAYTQTGDRENPELSALLRMLSSQDAYRRIYQTRAEPLLVADLFLRHSESPRSLRHSLFEIETALDDLQVDAEMPSVAIGGPEANLAETIAFLSEVRKQLEECDFHQLDEKKQNVPAKLWSALLQRFYRFHQVLSDHYFSHQANLSGTEQKAEEVVSSGS